MSLTTFLFLSFPNFGHHQSQIQVAFESLDQQQQQVPSDNLGSQSNPPETLPSIPGSPRSLENTPGPRRAIFNLPDEAPLAPQESFTDPSEIQLNVKRFFPSFTYVGSSSSLPF